MRSADVLQTLGVNIEIGPDKVGKCLDEAGIGFLFAPMLHGAMKHAIGPRREIGARTVFNALGPLTNPAGARRQLIGVYDGDLTEKLAGVLHELGSERAFVVHGSDGLDEITLTGMTRVAELKGGSIETYEIRPEDFGFDSAGVEELKGGNAEENAGILREVLDGGKGPRSDVVLMNAAAAIVAGGMASSLEEGVDRARSAISSGRAREALEKLKGVSNS